MSFRILSVGWIISSWMHAGEMALDHHVFWMPEGLVVEKVAGPPLVNRPIVADLDARGDLYVADSSGSNDKVAQQLETRPHRIVRLRDQDGDGLYDSSVVFADGLMFPEGILCYQGAVYCAAPPQILRLEDTNGDGQADRREVWMDGKTLTGCANDLHGPYLGPDGWIYWAKGAFARQQHTLFDGSTIDDSAAHLFRMLPDGTERDVVMSGGMDNPVEVTFDATGEVFFTTTFVSHPRSGKRDGLVHALYRGVYPKEHGVLDGLILTGPYLDAMTHLGPAAPSGLMTYQSNFLGEGFQGNLFSTQFNLRRIQRHQLIPKEGSYITKDEDFLVSSHHDFHPTDVLEDGDGSILVLDTGGWYKLCCPTSQLYKPDILGAIYRVRPEKPSSVTDPYGNQVNWDHLSLTRHIDLLIDERHRVREKAMQKLVRQGHPVLPRLLQRLQLDNVSSKLRQQIVWTLCRMHSTEALQALQSVLKSSEASLVCTALHAIGIHHDARASEAVMDCLRHADPKVRRRAAEALGRMKVAEAIEPLLESAPSMQSRALEHAAVQALVQLDADSETLVDVVNSSDKPQAKRIALLALSQLNDSEQVAALVGESFFAEASTVRDAALWISGFHPEWGETLAAVMRKKRSAMSSSQDPEGQSLLALLELCKSLVTHPSIQVLLGEWLEEDQEHSHRLMVSILDTMAPGKLRKMPHAWVGVVSRFLARSELPEWKQSLMLDWMIDWKLDASSFPELQQVLRQLATKNPASPENRLKLLQCNLSDSLPLANSDMRWLVEQYLHSEQEGAQDRVMDIWQQSQLQGDSLPSLLDAMVEAGPLDLNRMVQWFNGAQEPALGEGLLRVLAKAPSAGSLRVNVLLRAVEQFPDAIREQARLWIQTRQMDLEGQRKHLESVLAKLPGGDVRRGQAVFKAEGAACSKCHQIGYVGGRAGPDLSKIGAVRDRRDLLESILYPNASFVRSYEPVHIELVNGETVSGVMQQENKGLVRLMTGPQSELLIEEKDIHALLPSQVSLMPSGLGDLLTLEQLADLLAFLESRR